jgi:uncharacterized protein YjiS (DUF1127 family)
MNTLTLHYHGHADSAAPVSTRDLPVLLRVWYQRARQRRQLAQMNAWQLEDIGISRDAALDEAGKPFWQP